MVLHIDIETASEADLKIVGLDSYANHPSTRVLMLAHAFDDNEVELWEPHKTPMPASLRDALIDPQITKFAWNAAFEIHVLSVTQNLPLRLPEWFDTMAHSRYLGFPGSLDAASRVLGLGEDTAKSKEGKRLIKLFSCLTRGTKKHPQPYFKDWDSDPADWDLFLMYCRRDVIAEREIGHRLQSIGEFPTDEYRCWVFDQIVNARGIPVDETFVRNALALAEKETAEVLQEMQRITQCANPNSGPQMKSWFASQGCPMDSLDKEHVTSALKNTAVIDAPREILMLKQRLGGSAHKKLVAILDRMHDGRLRHQFIYHKAHTGRFASMGVNVQNLLRPTPRVKADTDAIVDAVLNNRDLSLLGIPLIEAVSGVLRASFRAPAGSRFLITDLSQIENRILAWFADCPAMLQVYADGLCAYKSFAVKMYHKDYGEITSDERQKAKPVVLGSGFGMGSKRLQAYAENMGVTLTEEESENYIDTFRATYPEIVDFWANLGAAAMQAVQNFCRLRLGKLLIDGTDPEMLRIILPSGRPLHYPRPMVMEDPDWAGKTVLIYEGMGKCWSVIKTRGAQLVENVVQAASRDLLVGAMMRAHKQGFRIVMHCHDEMVSETRYDSPLTLAGFNGCMTVVPTWAEGLPVAAEGFESQYYRK